MAESLLWLGIMVPTHTLFTVTETKPSRGLTLVLSVLIHVFLAAVLIVAPLFLVQPIRVKHYDLTLLAPPSPRPALVMPKAPLVERPKPVITPPQIKPSLAIAESKPAEIIKLPEVRVEPKPVPLPAAAPRVEVAALPDLTPPAAVLRPPKPIQTGGFGDPNGASAEGRPNKSANVAALGSFDLTAGEGSGNGAKGRHGVVTGAGFGSSGSGGAGDGLKPKAAFIRSSFENVDAPAPQVRRREVASANIPVEILDKPRPEYTDEGRRLRIQGEVSLRVVFPASGPVEVLGVVQGLGCGLDESAIRAAKKIQFKPALHDGLPVDSPATIRIAFQLAY